MYRMMQSYGLCVTSSMYYLYLFWFRLECGPNGKIPKFFDEEMLNNIFQKPTSSLCPGILNIQRGLKETGITSW